MHMCTYMYTQANAPLPLRHICMRVTHMLHTRTCTQTSSFQNAKLKYNSSLSAPGGKQLRLSPCVCSLSLIWDSWSSPAFRYGAASRSIVDDLVGAHVSVLGRGVHYLNAGLCPSDAALLSGRNPTPSHSHATLSPSEDSAHFCEENKTSSNSLKQHCN